MKIVIYLFSLLLISSLTHAELKVSSVFGDHMVLQRDQPVPVWGKTKPGTEVMVRFRDQTVRATADTQGKWMAELSALSVGPAENFTVSSGEETITFNDVLVGEVWICSGQSNMEWPVRRSANPEEEIQSANYPKIRLFDVPHEYAPTPQETIDASWKVCSPETVADFSAVAYSFGRALWKELGVPIGLISSNWGGTRAEAWTPLDTLKSNPDYQDFVESHRSNTEILKNDPGLKARLQAKFDAFNRKMDFLSRSTPIPDSKWFNPDAEFDGTELVEPGVDFLKETDGLIHVQTTFNLAESQASQPGAKAMLGQMDNYDVTWINGVQIGRMGPELDTPRSFSREYDIPAGTLKPGVNVMLIQIVDVRKDASFGKNIEQPHLKLADGQIIELDNKWRMKIIEDAGARPDTLDRIMKHSGSYLYNGMIAPLVPVAFQGVIWYQGESNAKRADQYRSLFPDMITSWRNAWGRGDFPFYFVQLANFSGRPHWAELREAQRETLRLPNTGMAVTIDIGDPKDIHPKNKQDVGKRLSLWALAKTYGVTRASSPAASIPFFGKFFQEPLPHSGPLFREAEIEGNQIRLKFDHVYGGLQSSDGDKLKGFLIAAENEEFQPADAFIEGDDVIVSHPEIQSPADVRYAWATDPEANLTNSEGLPASPFRTDHRPFLTAKPE